MLIEDSTTLHALTDKRMCPRFAGQRDRCNYISLLSIINMSVLSLWVLIMKLHFLIFITFLILKHSIKEINSIWCRVLNSQWIFQLEDKKKNSVLRQVTQWERAQYIQQDLMALNSTSSLINILTKFLSIGV